ncbi:hypothetical protein QQZ08_001394 [Neonectria magnoliae]|uniref:AB hydrolase-1 domain-containing protein n=1 Tax=Neonectria magnoliae TaxID=2732573 RepID=A0ABR1IFM5_9HYPO
MTKATQPTIIVIPGAWHRVSCMNLFIRSLQAAGFPAEGITLLGVGHADISVADDETFIRSKIEPYIQAGKDVILIVHSYAGFPATAAISGFDSKGRRARGESGGVLGIAYLAAFVPLEGESVLSLLENSLLWWMKDNPESRVIETHSQADVFYNDCSPDQIAAVTATIEAHATKSLTTPAASIGWRDGAYDGRRAYIRCLRDKALLLEKQDAFIERSGVEWIVKTLDASHSPFLSIPQELTRVVEELVNEFASTV